MDPQTLTCRSPVYRKLQNLDAEFAEINGYAVAITIGDSAAQATAVRQLSLCDLSGLARFGLKGPGAGHWLAEQGFAIPPDSNRALRQRNGALLARLAPTEFLVLGDLDPRSLHIEQLLDAWRQCDEMAAAMRGFIVPRQDSHAWFRITGREAAATLAKLCAVDFRAPAFDPLQVAQTSIARLNAIVIADDVFDIPAFHLLADTASAGYWWDCLLDAGAEYDMGVVGLDALRDSNRS